METCLPFIPPQNSSSTLHYTKDSDCRSLSLWPVGTPVLTADNSCLPEAGGEGALYVDAESIERIADGIIQLATQPALRTRLATAGHAHAGAFTWQRSLRQLLDAYERALA